MPQHRIDQRRSGGGGRSGGLDGETVIILGNGRWAGNAQCEQRKRRDHDMNDRVPRSAEQ